ncbi:MAG: ROK family protein [Clostridia bacterium]
MTVKNFLHYVQENAMPVKAPLDPAFVPAAAFDTAYQAGLTAENGLPVRIAIERSEGHISTFTTQCYADEKAYGALNCFYFERVVKSLLWAYGGWRVIFGGPAYIGEMLQNAYTEKGLRAFDVDFMSNVYERPFVVEVTAVANVPVDVTGAKPIGRHLDGCRIGFDAGGSDRKVSAVIDGEAVYSEEVVWYPKLQSDPSYHYDGIVSAMKSAAAHMPRVDGIGVSSAGVYISNRTMVASLFLKVPKELFNAQVKDIYLRAAKEIGNVPIEVANDGDVTALAGAMDLEDNNVLGIAMGTSEAGGFVDGNGNITGWLNELAFVPVAFEASAMVDEWSGDFGCGVKYFSQDAVAKLAPAAGILLEESLSPADKLKKVQALCVEGHEKALQIFDTIGVYLGYQVAYYARFYDLRHVLILGRVTSGEGGPRILAHAEEVLKTAYPALATQITLHLPDESSRRVGQSIAAASLPVIG